MEQRSGKSEIPSLLNIGAAYDWHINEVHRLTVAGTFISNSFTQDQAIIGLEYAFRKMVHLRGGYTYEKKDKSDVRATWYTGPSAGLSVDFPFGEEKKSTVALDYAYRSTNPFSGIHCLGIRLSF